MLCESRRRDAGGGKRKTDEPQVVAAARRATRERERAPAALSPLWRGLDVYCAVQCGTLHYCNQRLAARPASPRPYRTVPRTVPRTVLTAPYRCATSEARNPNPSPGDARARSLSLSLSRGLKGIWRCGLCLRVCVCVAACLRSPGRSCTYGTVRYPYCTAP